MKCPNCQHENRPSATFCTRCRTKLPRACPQCGAVCEPEDLFCGACGADLPTGATATVLSTADPTSSPPRSTSLEQQFARLEQALPSAVRQQLLALPEGETRIVTLLFADMTSSLATTTGLHPEDAANLINQLLRAMVDILLDYEGRIDRFLGDGVLAVFGAPQAHENDPERAIVAALEIREAAQKLGLSVTAGINTGQVYVGEVGNDRHQEYTVMGPVVSLASRLQGKAEPDQILVGETTYRHTRRAFAFTPLSLDVRGIPQPVIAYAVERPLPRPERVRGIEGLRAELIGREEELARLKDALAEVMRGRGQIVSVIGEAGVGKSRLVAELKSALGAGGWALGGEGSVPTPHPPALWVPEPPTPNAQSPTPLWLEGRCLELGMTATYWLFVDLLREHFGFAPDDDDRTRAGRLTSRIERLVEGGSLSGERIEEIGRLLGNLLSVRFGDAQDERLRPEGARPAERVMSTGPEQVRRQTFMAIRDYLIALARQQPVVLVFEDLQWADTLSLDLILLLMDALTLAPLLLLCIYRPEREHKCWLLGTQALQKCPERYTEIGLRELTPAQSRHLVESLLAIGNLPETVKEMILEKARGNPFFVEEVIRSLVDAGAVYREGQVWRAREGIEEIQVPETVQGVILSRVDRLEQDLKRVLESASVIGRLFRKRVLEHVLREQAELERALWQLEDRQLIYEERVLPEEEYSFKHVLTQETIYQSLLKRRRALFHQRVAAAMEALYEDGLDEYYEQLAYHYERGGNHEKAIEYLLSAAEKAHYFNADAEGIQHLKGALRLLDGLPEDEAHLKLRWEATAGLRQAYTARLEREHARGVLLDYLALAERAGCVWGAAAAHFDLSLLAWFEEGDIRLARDHSEQSLALGERYGLADGLPRVRWWLAHWLTIEPETDFPRAEALLRQTLEDREGLSPAQVQKAYASLMWACAHQGKWEEALAALRESITVGGLRELMVHCVSQMEEGLDALGRRAEFVAFCDEARRIVAEAGTPSALTQWYLEPAQPSGQFSEVQFEDHFEAPQLRPEWQWHDPLQASAYSLADRPGYLTLRAAEGTDLNSGANVNAPRLLLEVRGDFALEARMEGDWDEQDQVGSSGLLVWKDVRNFLRLEKFCMSVVHHGSVQFEARIKGEYRIVGRGLLRGDIFHLRLERVGKRFTALCSADGMKWLTCGRVDFPARDPLLVGIASLRGVVAHFDCVRVLTRR